MKLRPIPEESTLPDGVYIGLDDKRYFAQDALGSTDLASLWLKGAGWWWRTRRNPFYAEPPSQGKNFGRAAHALLLEGRGAYEARYFVEPNPAHYPNLLVSIVDIKSALAAAGAPSLPYKASKDQFVEAARAYLPEANIWDHIVAKARNVAQGREALSAEEAYHLECMYEMAMSDPTLAVICTSAGGVCLPEIAVFWTLADGTRLRFKFDSLLPSAVADLKTFENYRDRDVKDAIALSIGDYGLDIQAAMSFEARKAVYEHILAGRVFGGNEEQVDWLSRFPEEAPLDLGDRPGWLFVWAFYQKPDNSGRAPGISVVKFHYGSKAHLEGFRRASHGLELFRTMKGRLGLDNFWREETRVFELRDDGAATSISYPFARRVPAPVVGEEEAVAWRALKP